VATFLTNPKMSPALRARVEASVSGRSAAQASASPRARALVRLLAFGAIVLSIGAFALDWWQGRQELARIKAQLVSDTGDKVEPLAKNGRLLLAATRAVIVGATGSYEGDLVDPAVTRPGGLERLLARPAVYLRGPSATLSARFEQGVAESNKDAFVTCLLAPPSSAAEDKLLSKVKLSYGGALAVEETAHIHALRDVAVAEPFFGGQWLERVRAAGSLGELSTLRQELEEAQLSRALRAVSAEILIYVIDEPKKAGTVAELDGATDHMARVGIVELASSRTMLRRRQRVDPSWISEARRVNFAQGFCGCRLAVDVRRSVASAGSAG
jgi:hypothetical protein